MWRTVYLRLKKELDDLEELDEIPEPTVIPDLGDPSPPGELGELHIRKHTGERHTATIIIFHGACSSGEDMKEWIRIKYRKFVFPHIKILYPTSPLMLYTVDSNQVNRVWFDRVGLDPTSPEQVDSISVLEKSVMDLIKKENDIGIPSSRIIVGGFCMGGTLALHTALRWDRNLAGVFGINTYLNHDSLVYKDLKDNPADDNKLPQLLLVQGNMDEVVDYTWGNGTFYRLLAVRVQGKFSIRKNLGHKIDKKGMARIKRWILEILPNV